METLKEVKQTKYRFTTKELEKILKIKGIVWASYDRDFDTNEKYIEITCENEI